jgi:hypothetical protein
VGTVWFPILLDLVGPNFERATLFFGPLVNWAEVFSFSCLLLRQKQRARHVLCLSHFPVLVLLVQINFFLSCLGAAGHLISQSSLFGFLAAQISLSFLVLHGRFYPSQCFFHRLPLSSPVSICFSSPFPLVDRALRTGSPCSRVRSLPNRCRLCRVLAPRLHRPASSLFYRSAIRLPE